ncbi:uncharacterized protein LOC122849974 [Aphidius gifuensis]|uniref:uncharacterized protein LOC122849974 n=1 Tax=Aphidius gifuensis TaxID=684658 RepID=UPI001CDC4A88|nr:uncharacterized protein LOC122849974 [Aphidius gifuensis]
MKLFIILIFCASAWSIPTENVSFRPENILKFYRDRVESVSVSLENYNNAAMTTMTEKLMEMIANKKIQIHEAEGKTFKDAHEKIEAATAEGKKVEHCLVAMATSINDWKNSLFLTLDDCLVHRKNVLSYIQERAVNHIAKKATLTARLDQILVDCTNEDDKTYQSCIRKHNLRITPIVGAFYMYAEFLKEEEKAVVFTSEHNMSFCFKKPVGNFHDHLATGTATLDKCIADTPVEAA